MKQIGKRMLSLLCVLSILLSIAAVIVPGPYTAEAASTDEIDAIPSAHLITVRDHTYFAFDADEGTNYVDDADAFGGKAVCYSRANFDNGDFIGIHRYESATGVDASIAQLFLADLKVDQGYQIYKFTYDVPANATENGVLYIMPNWQLNSDDLCRDIYPYAGKTVELYFSMKVTKNDNGLYSVSVDRVALATVCKDHTGEDGVCSLCGSGSKDALMDMIPEEHLASVRDYSNFAYDAEQGTNYVDDAEAYGGKAVCYSKANFDGGDFIAVKRYDGGSEVSIKQMFKGDLHIDEGYHIYQIPYDVPADATEGTVFFIMPNWQLNSKDFCKDFYNDTAL